MTILPSASFTDNDLLSRSANFNQDTNFLPIKLWLAPLSNNPNCLLPRTLTYNTKSGLLTTPSKSTDKSSAFYTPLSGPFSLKVYPAGRDMLA